MSLCVEKQYVIEVSDASGAGVRSGCEPPGIASGTHALNQQATSSAQSTCLF